MRNPLPFILGALALTACATPPPTPPPQGAAGRLSGGGLDALLGGDANGDGVITRGEYAAAREARFAQLDRDGDGRLSRADAAGRGGGRRAAAFRSGARRNGGGLERLRQTMTALDADGDGRVSRAEFVEGPSRLFDLGDANRDGRLEPHEIEALRARIAARGG